MRNITFSADEDLIEAARAQARADDTTLNEPFRLWLAAYARRRQVERFLAVLGDLRATVRTGGRRFTRDEMDER
jgi:hypothetical protein